MSRLHILNAVCSLLCPLSCRAYFSLDNSAVHYGWLLSWSTQSFITLPHGQKASYVVHTLCPNIQSDFVVHEKNR